jgi:hypothetical protein
MSYDINYIELSFSLQIGVPRVQSPNGGLQIRVQKSGSQNQGPKIVVQKSWSQNRCPKIVVPKSRSPIKVLKSRSPIKVPKSGSQNRGPQIGVPKSVSPIKVPKSGSRSPNQGGTVVWALTSRIFFFFFFFSSYMLVLIYLMTFLRKKIIFPIKWGKWVHEEVREFFLQKLIFAVLCTVLGVFRPWHRIYKQLQTNKCITYLKQPYSSTFIWNRWTATEMTGTNSVSMMKLHNFPFFSTKNRKNQLLQKKISNFCIDQFSSFGLKIYFFLHKRHHIDCNL